MAGDQALPALGGRLVDARQRRGRDDLRQDRPSHVGHDLQAHQPLDDRPRGPDPAHAQAGPEDLAHRSDRDDERLGIVGGDRRGHGAIGHPQVAQREVLDHRDAVARRQLGDRAAAGLRQHRPGRVLEHRHQVDEAGADALQQVGHRVHDQAVLVQRDPHRPHARPAGQVEGAGVGRLLHEHRLAGLAEEGGDQADGLLGARGDQHLVRAASGAPARSAARRCPPAARGALRAGSPSRRRARPARRRSRGRAPRRRRWSAAARRRTARSRRRRPPIRSEKSSPEKARSDDGAGGGRADDPGAAALPAVEHPLLLQRAVGPDDGRAADVQALGELALGGQDGLVGQLAAVDGRRAARRRGPRRGGRRRPTTARGASPGGRG